MRDAFFYETYVNRPRRNCLFFPDLLKHARLSGDNFFDRTYFNSSCANSIFLSDLHTFAVLNKYNQFFEDPRVILARHNRICFRDLHIIATWNTCDGILNGTDGILDLADGACFFSGYKFS